MLFAIGLGLAIVYVSRKYFPNVYTKAVDELDEPKRSAWKQRYRSIQWDQAKYFIPLIIVWGLGLYLLIDFEPWWRKGFSIVAILLVPLLQWRSGKQLHKAAKETIGDAFAATVTRLNARGMLGVAFICIGSIYSVLM